MLPHTISDSNLQIKDSYLVSKKRFRKELNEIKEAKPDYAVWNRSITGMVLEWATHNWFYNLGIKPESTKDVDLNYPRKFWEKILYFVLGCIGWIFIK